ncbi:hypothetical protein [Marilutibacter spongiae]|uniref:Lysozyme inhibitor LprI N-terminal domain-containing protein n=1 Tax=Marilutibacter spongiae TaxID=2025720 RepID=A0A7W3Y7A7_9GAMM|nr:hypothetical protein [Lysobacter spongiae]MBB1061771.1 hypothetical protein [Lysobacter spongiae]
MSCTAVLALGLSVTSLAADTAAIDLAALRSEQARIQAGATAGTGVYEDMSKARRQEVLERQARISAAIEGKQSMDELDAAQRDAVADDVAWMERTLRDAEDNRQVCERRKKLGSNRFERVCMTVAQQREMREQARAQLQRSGVCEDCGGGG